jgi:hypothetical protein
LLFSLSRFYQFSPVITRGKTSDCTGGQKNEKKEISLVGVDERLPGLPAVFLCVLLDNGLVDALPFSARKPGSKQQSK